MENKPIDPKLLGRKSLKNLFAVGNRPSSENFGALIDSCLNKVEDGIGKNNENGLMLAPEGNDSEKLMSFYDSIQDPLPQWSLELEKENGSGLGIYEPISESEQKNRLFFKKGGNIGINSMSPRTKLEVSGVLASESRIGTYKLATVPADGKWHDILSDLNGCVAFEVMAQVGKEKKGKYALLIAQALSTFGNSKNKISTTQAHYGWWWNKLNLRWRGSTYKYSLQLRTRSDYGSDEQIRFYITKLWDTEIMNLFDSALLSDSETSILNPE